MLLPSLALAIITFPPLSFNHRDTPTACSSLNDQRGITWDRRLWDLVPLEPSSLEDSIVARSMCVRMHDSFVSLRPLESTGR